MDTAVRHHNLGHGPARRMTHLYIEIAKNVVRGSQGPSVAQQEQGKFREMGVAHV